MHLLLQLSLIKKANYSYIEYFFNHQAFKLNGCWLDTLNAIGSGSEQKWCPNVPSKWLLVVLLPAQAGSDAIGAKQLHTSIAYTRFLTLSTLEEGKYPPY